MLKRFSGELFVGAAATIALVSAAVSGYNNLGVGATMLVVAVLAFIGVSLTLRRRMEAALPPIDQSVGDSPGLEWFASELARREQELDNRLLVFHEWMEFPAPSTIQQPQRSDDEWIEVSERDRRLFQLLEDESQRVFDKILANEYSEDGRVQIDLIRDEALAFVTSVAQIYRPDLSEPLMETSSEKVLRAASRICLQLLVLTEQLPLDVKSYNLRRLHTYIQKAVKAYGMYRSVEPYWPLLNRAYYLGRFAMGASPVSLGAWWAASSLGSRGAKELASQLVNQQAMRLLQDLVRVVGFEVASLYSVDFRYRDGNWIYASLLTDLTSTRDLDSKTLTTVMAEMGTLPLRSEYDRVFLYRCVATHHAAPIGNTPLSRFLEPGDRRAVCRRLHAFSQKLSIGQEELPGEWIERVESWLDVRWPKSKLAGEADVDQAIVGIRSLMGFVLEYKNLEPDVAIEHLKSTRLLRRLEADVQLNVCKQMEAEPPFFFEQPMLDIESALANEYCDDLVELAISLLPYDPAEEDLFRQVAAYLHVEEEALVQKRDDESLERLSRQHVHLQSTVPPSGTIARAVLELVPDEGGALGLYQGAFSEGESGKVDRDLWVLATDSKLFALRVVQEVSVEWVSSDDTTLEVVSAWSGNYAVLTGGEWSASTEENRLRIHVPAGLLQRSDAFFDPLRTSIG